MWITKNVNLPESLMKAQREGRLVVFAGAGVSIGPPANLPGFSELANKVAGEAFEKEITEPFDRFLGRLEKHGLEVHQRTQDIISNPDSKPTQLHRDLLSIFQSPQSVRLITTNFDRHFTTVSKQLYQEEVEIYYAPALPLGRECSGLTYLHGSVDKPSDRIVLTDSDFGRAYLTDGWATRFLREVFAEYTVLFVGYSHDDVVMSYLARALLPGTSRYAFTPSGREDHWSLLEITSVTYPVRQEPDGHIELREAIAAWVELTKKGALDHERRIREIVDTIPPVEPVDSDYINSALDDLVTVRFFTRHAQSLEWLNWVENKEAFRSLFQSNYEVNDIALELGNWFARNFACDHADEALSVIQRLGQRLNPGLWHAITAELAHPTSRPEATTLSKWVTVLLNSVPPEPQLDSLSMLIARCKYPEDTITALLLFETLTRPRLRLKRTGAEVEVKGDEYWISKFWKEFFLPNLADFSARLESILTNHLIQAHLLLQAFNKADDRWDPSSFSRSAIEPHEQDHHHTELRVLIDGARDVIEWILNHDSERANAVIDKWSNSGVPLFKRLATHGITEATHIAPDDKIDWILNRDWVFAFGMKHEVFRLLETAYSKASESVRLRLLKRVSLGPQGVGTENLEERTREYEIYNALVWLNQKAPDCNLAAKHLEDMQGAHPNFRPREHPDFYSWTSNAWSGPRSPLTVEGLLAKDPQEEIEWLLTYQGEEFTGPDREGLLDTLTQAVNENFEWSWNLASVLKEKQEWNSDIWTSILRSWQSSSLKEAQWKKVLSVLAEHELLSSSATFIAELLRSGMEGRQQEGLPYSYLPLAENIGDRLWDICANESEDSKVSGSHDWLVTAINHPGGIIAQFWILALSRKQTEAGDDWNGLPERYEQFLSKIVDKTSHFGELGRVVLAGQLHFLFALDADWTLKNILPLFDWSVDDRQAQQAWHGFLVWGRWNEALLPHLLPLYIQGFAKLSSELSSMRDQFCQDLTGIALYSSINPLDDGWLRLFISEADPESHRTWARTLGQQLSYLQPEQIQEIWNRWLDRYWSDRNSGVPLPLSAEEKREMLLWAIDLKPLFPEFVEKITATDVGSPEHTSLYRNLMQEDLADTHPEALAKLLHHLLSGTSEGFYECNDVIQLVQSLSSSEALRPILLEICNELARLGCLNVDKLERLVKEGGAD